ncbi:MAG TPA: aldehyde dehydrogenase family protein [Syntrophomonadaceae bacterium]|nr:aldehyde dehydrogenase family protein [Syntrophomonadaceae bacterium]
MAIDMQTIFPEAKDIPDAFRCSEIAPEPVYLIDGQLKVNWDKVRAVQSPILIRNGDKLTSPHLGECPHLTGEESMAALQAAIKVFDSGMGSWPMMKNGERLDHMRTFLQHMRGKEKTFALLEMWETGKKYQDCLNEFQRTLTYIEDTMKAFTELEKDTSIFTRVGPTLALIRRQPLGVVLCLGPFNYPLNETFALVIPALLMGNSVVFKQPDQGALCTLPLLEDMAASFPPGVINVINGNGAETIGPIMESGSISILGFIGSSRVANLLIHQHPRNNRLRTILGLEAKNAAYILPDANLDLAIRECIAGALEFNGQRCTAIKQIWVHKKLLEPFLSGMDDYLQQLGYGMPWQDEVMLTPLAEPNKVAFLNELVNDAQARGAQVVNSNGGMSYGTFFFPAVVYPVEPSMRIYQEEQFGPVIPVGSFSRLDDLFTYFRNSDYGQQASIFTRSPAQAGPLIDILVNQVSRVNLNTRCQRSPDELPFTGRKGSAEGTLSVKDALRAFSIRSLAVANEQGRELFFSLLAGKNSEFLRL